MLDVEGFFQNLWKMVGKHEVEPGGDVEASVKTCHCPLAMDSDQQTLNTWMA